MYLIACARGVLDPRGEIAGPRTSPAITTRLVVARVSAATRISIGVDAGLGAFAKKQIDDFVGNPVADFVRMALRDGFARKKIVFPSHRASSANASVEIGETLRRPRRAREESSGEISTIRSFGQANQAVTFFIAKQSLRICRLCAPPARRARFLAGEARDEIDDALAHLRIVDARESHVEMEPFGRGHEIGDIARVCGLGDASDGPLPIGLERAARPRRRRPAERRACAKSAAAGWRRSDWCLSRISVPAGTSAQRLAEFLLAHAKNHAPHAHPAADIAIDRIRTFFTN